MPGNCSRCCHRIIVSELKYKLVEMTFLSELTKRRWTRKLQTPLSCPFPSGQTDNRQNPDSGQQWDQDRTQTVQEFADVLNLPRYFGSFLKSFILSSAGSFIDDPSGTFDSVSADSILFISVLNGPSAQTDCIPVDVKAKHNLVEEIS